MVDAGLAADRRVDLREQRRRDLHERHPPLVDRRGEAGRGRRRRRRPARSASVPRSARNSSRRVTMSCSVGHALCCSPSGTRMTSVATSRAARPLRSASRRWARDGGVGDDHRATADDVRQQLAGARGRRPRRCGSGSCDPRARLQASSRDFHPCGASASSAQTKRTTASRSDVDDVIGDLAIQRHRAARTARTAAGADRRPAASGGDGCCPRDARASPARREGRSPCRSLSVARGLRARSTAPPPVASTTPVSRVRSSMIASSRSRNPTSPSISKIVGIVTPSRSSSS